jgi:hypothetical protein
MTYYCSSADVAIRLGLDAAQQTRSANRLTSVIRRATVEMDMTYRDYGRAEPSRETATSTLNGSVAAGSTTITLVSASSFSTAGNGNIDGDNFAWTGKSSNDLTGCTNISADHATAATVQEGEFAAVMREVCADIAAGMFLQDDAALSSDAALRAPIYTERGYRLLHKTAKLGTVD